MFSRLGSFAYRRRWAIIAVWAAVLFAGIFLAPRADTVLRTTVGAARSEAADGLKLLETELGLPPSVVIVVFSHERLTIRDQAFREDVEGALGRLRGAAGLARVDSYLSAGNSQLISADGRVTYALVWLNVPLERAIDAMPDIRARLGSAQTVRIQVTGAPAIYQELEEATERDLRKGELLAIPLVLIALLLIFGGVIASGLPVLMGGASLILTLAVLYFLAQATDISVFAKNVASLLALGIAVDYTLFLVSRFREEIRHRGVETALQVTVATAGKAVLFSGIITILGLSGLLLVKFSFLHSLGIGGIVVVVLSLAVALTLVPAVLGVLGPRINALPVLPRQDRSGTFWHSLAQRVMARPLFFLIPSGTMLILLGAPFLWIQLGPIWAGTLPQAAPAREGWEFAGETFGPGNLTPILIVVQGQGSILAPQNVGGIYDYSKRLAAVPGVEGIDSIVDVAPGISKEGYQLAYSDPNSLSPDLKALMASVVHGSTTVLRVRSPYRVASPEAKELVRRLRAVPAGSTLTRYVTGASASLQDSIDVLYSDFPKVAAFVVGSIYVALLLLFRSVVLALKAIVMNALSIFASFGALVFIFQWGYFQDLLHFKADGSVEASQPILLFCMVFGLSMDYGVFLMSRIKEEWDRTGDNTQAVALGMERSGKIITSAAMVVVAVGIAFALGDVVLTKALGLGLAIAVFLDATFVRALLVPSLMRLLGRWNWWAPKSLLRLLPKWDG